MSDPRVDADRLGDLARLFARLGLTAFGGPAAHIALFRHEVVARRRWMSEQRYLDILGAASLLPGPTSTIVAIGIGRELAGWRGMLATGGTFILPSALMAIVIAVIYERSGSIPQVAGLLTGVQPVVIALVSHALLGLAPTALRTLSACVVAVAVAALAVVGTPPLVLLVGAALVAVASGVPRALLGRGHAGLVALAAPWAATAVGSGAVAGVGLLPLAVALVKSALLVFGSGYVLLAVLRTELVIPGLLTDRQLLDAVAVGQVMPGPVFTAATFIGYLLAGLPGALVATVAIFLPAFILVALIHPAISRLRASPTARALLDGVNAAAVGLILSVVVDLGRVAITGPVSLALALGSLAVLLTTRISPVWLIGAGALVGVLQN